MTYGGWWGRQDYERKPRKHLMGWTAADVRRLQKRVRRAASAVARPFRALGRFPSIETTHPETGPLMERNYRDLVARGEGQTWTQADEEAFAEKVRRIHGR